MITNSKLTIYHHTIKDYEDIWTRYNYDNVWFFGGEGAGINKGYDNANNVEVRIPYDQNSGLDISNFAIGDIIVKGSLETNITSQSDLSGIFYTITSISNNNFGNNQHIHLGGK